MLRTCAVFACLGISLFCLVVGGGEHVAIAQSVAATCSANTGTSTVSVSLSASRITGVAPLAVFFDATKTEAPRTVCPFHDLDYRWDFGDSDGGSWSAISDMPIQERNLASGPIAAYVFENPGSYEVELTVSDGKARKTARVSINVSNPDDVFPRRKTICFSNKSSFVGCPEGAKKVANISDFRKVMAHVRKGKRLLLERGGIWNAASSGVIGVTGPGILGAFGTGPQPIIRMTGNSAILILSDRNSPKIRDWRVMDLNLDGRGGSKSRGVEARGTMSQITLLRLTIHDVAYGLSFSESILDYWNANGSPGHILWDQLAIFDSVVDTIVHGGYGAYVSAEQLSMIGNRITESSAGQHLLRIPFARKAVISHNELSKPAEHKHALKLHAHSWTRPGVSNPGGVGTFSEQIVVSDNKFSGGASNTAWPVSVGPQNGSEDERVRDVIFERNWHVAAPGDQLAIHLGGVSKVSIRNSVFDGSGAAGLVGGIAIDRRGIEPMSDGIHIYNNTFYNNGAGKGYWAVLGNVAASNVSIKNNLAYAPNTTSPAMYAGRQGAGFVASRNSTMAQIKNDAPGWVNATPTVPADFALQAGSYAQDAGEAVPVLSDFFGAGRPQNDLFDLGAMERP